MSSEIVPSVADVDDSNSSLSTTVAIVPLDTPYNESEVSSGSTSKGQPGFDSSTLNTTGIQYGLNSEYIMFQAFIIIEIVMTTIELIISIIAAIKMPRWRRNYRNQMLMQLTFARFIKRIIFTFKFLEENGNIKCSDLVTNVINSFQIYIDFVVVILVFFFIKHMYNSLIIVLVKISHNNLYRVLICSWVIPLVISAGWTAMITTDLVDKWYVNLIICSVFRWPLIFVGTGLYVTIVYRVLSDKIRQFARSLTVVTFLLCLTINIYLFSKDIMDLWCFTSLITVSYISGFLMNLLILILYVILLVLSCNNNTQTSRSLPDYSLADVNNKF